MIYPKISILTPTFNRREFLPLMINNIENFYYPKDKIEWNILDSYSYIGEIGKQLFNTDKEIKDLEKKLNIKINYNYIKKKLNIGEKRNILSENSNYDYLINMDDDDIYFPTYIINSIETLYYEKKDIVGCLDMLFIYPRKGYKISYIKCVNNFILYDESTLCMKKNHWEKYKYVNTSQGEGNTIYGDSDKCGITSIYKSCICTCWEKNTINKEYFLRYPIILNIDYKILKSIFYKKDNMEEEKKIKIEENNKETIEISKELLQNIRNLIEVTNNRIQWKTEELLPVGIILKNIDELLKEN